MICGSPRHLSDDHVETGTKTKKRAFKDLEKPSAPTVEKRPKTDVKYDVAYADGSQVCLAFNKLGRNKLKGCQKFESECRHKHVCANCRTAGHIAGDCKKPAAHRMASRD